MSRNFRVHPAVVIELGQKLSTYSLEGLPLIVLFLARDSSQIERGETIMTLLAYL